MQSRAKLEVRSKESTLCGVFRVDDMDGRVQGKGPRAKGQGAVEDCTEMLLLHRDPSARHRDPRSPASRLHYSSAICHLPSATLKRRDLSLLDPGPWILVASPVCLGICGTAVA